MIPHPLETAANRPILIVENPDAGEGSLARAARSVGFLNPLVCLPDSRTLTRYLEGQGIYANREEYPLPGLILQEVTLPPVAAAPPLLWLAQPPAARQVAVTAMCGAVEPGQFESAVAFGPNTVLCKLGSADSVQAMLRVLRRLAWQDNPAPHPSMMPMPTFMRPPASLDSLRH